MKHRSISRQSRSKALLACPFCGGNAECQDPHTWRINHEEGCILTIGIWYNYIIGPEQVAQWNQRANDGSEARL